MRLGQRYALKEGGNESLVSFGISRNLRYLLPRHHVKMTPER